jgi:hypothetical protein
VEAGHWEVSFLFNTLGEFAMYNETYIKKDRRRSHWNAKAVGLLKKKAG